jgi:hypothetical protein
MALKKELLGIEARYEVEAERVFGQEHPGTAENVRQLDDALLDQLKSRSICFSIFPAMKNPAPGGY